MTDDETYLHSDAVTTSKSSTLTLCHVMNVIIAAPFFEVSFGTQSFPVLCEQQHGCDLNEMHRIGKTQSLLLTKQRFM